MRLDVLTTSSRSRACSALAGKGVDDAGYGGADFRGDAARCQVETQQDAHETVPELQAGELVQRPYGDGEQRDERDRDSQVAITSFPVWSSARWPRSAVGRYQVAGGCAPWPGA